jgi:superfamily I DNA/RNA helicase
VMQAEDWRPADDLTLEPNALAGATERERCLALTAGPGAGKTEMLAQRADFLLRTGVCRYPKRILAISFKVDASRNLKERVRRRCGASLSARFDSHTFHAFAKRIIDRFRPVLTGDDALDADYTIGEQRVARRQISFGDLVPFAIQILQSCSAARNAVRLTYSDVFLDEFQDCTGQQYALIRLAFHGTKTRLSAVGDTKQRIMGWAGALEGIFVTFAGEFNAVPLNLYRNFRSQPQLLRMQNEIIRVLDSASVMPAELIEGDDGVIEVQRFDNSQEEAESLAEQVSHWITEEGVPCSEIAVLVSKQPELYAELLVAQLKERGIPFRNEAKLQDISVEPATRLIVDYLLVIFGSREPNAYARLMVQVADSAGDWEAQSKRRSDWYGVIRAERAKAEVSELSDRTFDSRWAFAVSFLREFGKERLVSLSAEYESGSRLKEVIADTKKRLGDLLESEPDIGRALALLTDERAVRIMTIHKSKGLEFDSVILLGVENEAFWGKPDDERCVFFVGVSRAKRRLVLTWSKMRERPAGSPRRWHEERSPHEEFLGYAGPYASEPS